MNAKTIRVTVYRMNPETDKSPKYVSYDVPFVSGMSAMTVLDYISLHMDPTLAYYDHAGCDLGICGRCTARINAKPGLLCQTIIEGDITIEPLNPKRVIRDLVIERKKEAKNG